MLDFDKAGGLVAAVAQDADTGEVLMVAWMNREAFEETVRTNRAVYFSRSRNKLWRKGEESGHFQEVRGIFIDCDADTVLLKVKQIGGAACHEGYKSCFFRQLDEGELKVIAERIFDPKAWAGEQPLRVVLIGTDFEVRVWETLLRIPMGRATTYSNIANHIGRPSAARAVGAAVGSKIAAGLIPIFDVYPMLLVAAGLLAACAALFRWVDVREAAREKARSSAAEPASDAPPAKEARRGAFRMVFQVRYLLLIALFSLIYNWVNSNGEYLLSRLIKAAAQDAVGRGEIGKAGVSAYIGAKRRSRVTIPPGTVS